MQRRLFLSHITKALGTTATLSAFPALADSPELDFLAQDALSTDEDFWAQVKQAYTVSSNIINLNNGGVSPQPKVVQETFEHYNRMSNEAPSYYMWRILDQGREALRSSLAELAGCSADEISINRNATEALDTVIFGLKLKKGDEVVLTKQDYPNMLNAWKWREKRDEIKLKYINLELPSEDENYLVKAFTEQFTPKTKVVHITHIINWNGQILPVKKIAAEARKRNILVMVDGAHTFAHLDFKIPDLDCDFFGTSLHKWLCAPFGNGLLYIRKPLIASIAPMFPGNEPESDDIRKFEALGTRSFPTEMATGKAIDFHLGIGSKRKMERLHYLKNYWAEKANEIPAVKVHTSLKPEWACALSIFSVQGKKPQEIEQFLFKEKGIHTVAIEWENISGVRVTPHVYTSLYDLDKLVDGIRKLAKT
ncbi:MAG: aminotransferase class V-fold PLP-dependent enzyme [Flavobacteriales bacterium]